MSNTITDLYLKYVNKVGSTLEKDRYFQYLFEMVRAGNTVLQQKNQILHKTVDERWLTTIEESLDAINAVIEKPRRYVATTEEIVPVDLAKKITADSVRHLSMNTQFIASSDDDDEVQPTRILNVSLEDSYDLYENRFVYHLIQRLIVFVDKRTDVIFWSTGDEKRSTLSMESKVDDGYEQIEYKLEMSVKNLQSFAENDSDNMEVFKRIDRVRRIVSMMRNSSFCSLMNGCARVRSPIQRTNLIMKDPQYRTCYRLWQFLESYDDVGYTIEAIDNSLEFDEEYLYQLYFNEITNYTVFKSLLEADQRRIEEAPAKHRRVIKPKFQKRIEEQIVNDYNIPEVEVRQVIIEEVTQAQLDAEAKLAEETARADAAEKACFEAERELQKAYQQMDAAIQAASEAQRQMEAAEKAKNDAETSLANATRAAGEAIAEATRARTAAEQTAQKAETARAAAEETKQKAVAARQTALERAKQDREARAAAESARAAAEKRAEEAIRERNAAQRQSKRDTVAREKAETAWKAAEEVRTEAQKTATAAKRAMTAAETRADRDTAAKQEAVAARKEAETARTKAEHTAAAARKAQETAQERAREDRAARVAAERAQRLAERAQQKAEQIAAAAVQEKESALAELQAARDARVAAERALAAEETAKKQALRAQSAAEQNAAAAQRRQVSAEKQIAVAQKKQAAAEAAREQAEAAQREAESERDAAQAKADANTISKRILRAWDKRRDRSDQ
jgi:predicted component of viral defense system (DUF524 family)